VRPDAALASGSQWPRDAAGAILASMRRTIAWVTMMLVVAGGAGAASVNARETTVTLSGGVGLGVSPVDESVVAPRGLALVRLTLSDSIAPPPMPAQPGYAEESRRFAQGRETGILAA
jgi:hypothetical protein